MMSSNMSDKIRKLLHLASDPGASAAEAASAAAMAAALGLKYNIELSQLAADHEVKSAKVFGAGQPVTSALPRDKAAHLILAQGVAELYGCNYLIQISHNDNKIFFVGQPHNVELCNTWLKYLWTACQRSNAEYAKTNSFTSKPARYKADGSFRLSFAAEVRGRLLEKLEAMRSQGVDQTSSGTALMVVNWYETEKREVAEWMAQNMKVGKLTTAHAKPRDHGAAVAGAKAGRELGLHDQIGATKPASTGLLQ